MTKKFHLIPEICFFILFIIIGLIFLSLYSIQASTCRSRGLITMHKCDELLTNHCVLSNTIQYDCQLAGPKLYNCVYNIWGTATRANKCYGLCTGPGVTGLLAPCSVQYFVYGCY
jgi:hypothetical protein